MGWFGGNGGREGGISETHEGGEAGGGFCGIGGVVTVEWVERVGDGITGGIGGVVTVEWVERVGDGITGGIGGVVTVEWIERIIDRIIDGITNRTIDGILNRILNRITHSFINRIICCLIDITLRYTEWIRGRMIAHRTRVRLLHRIFIKRVLGSSYRRCLEWICRCIHGRFAR